MFDYGAHRGAPVQPQEALVEAPVEVGVKKSISANISALKNLTITTQKWRSRAVFKVRKLVAAGSRLSGHACVRV